MSEREREKERERERRETKERDKRHNHAGARECFFGVCVTKFDMHRSIAAFSSV